MFILLLINFHTTFSWNTFPQISLCLHVKPQGMLPQPANALPFPASCSAILSERAVLCQLILSILHNYLLLNCCHSCVVLEKKKILIARSCIVSSFLYGSFITVLALILCTVMPPLYKVSLLLHIVCFSL